MATLTIRKLDDGVYDRLREQARTNNRSLEAEARGILESSAIDHRGYVAELRAMHDRLAARDVPLSDSVALIRAVRDE